MAATFRRRTNNKKSSSAKFHEKPGLILLSSSGLADVYFPQAKFVNLDSTCWLCHFDNLGTSNAAKSIAITGVEDALAQYLELPEDGNKHDTDNGFDKLDQWINYSVIALTKRWLIRLMNRRISSSKTHSSLPCHFCWKETASKGAYTDHKKNCPVRKLIEELKEHNVYDLYERSSMHCLWSMMFKCLKKMEDKTMNQEGYDHKMAILLFVICNENLETFIQKMILSMMQFNSKHLVSHELATVLLCSPKLALKTRMVQGKEISYVEYGNHKIELTQATIGQLNARGSNSVFKKDHKFKIEFDFDAFSTNAIKRINGKRSNGKRLSGNWNGKEIFSQITTAITKVQSLVFIMFVALFFSF